MAQSLQSAISTPQLIRTALQTSRLLDFVSQKELTAQTGHSAAEWPLVILKELVDNSLDACEEARIVPQIDIRVDRTGISISDNGRGIPKSTIDGVCDFSIRVSSREAYVAPDRGAQGNALKTILAIPYVLDGQTGRVEIESMGIRHGITVSVDHIRQMPIIQRDERSANKKNGTTIVVHWPNSARLIDVESDAHFLQNDLDDDFDYDPYTDEINSTDPVSACSILQNAKERFLQIAADYAWLNPHLTISVDWFGAKTTLEATNPEWRKWCPSDPSSSHWYDESSFERLITAYIAHDQKHKADRSVREFISEFNGLSGSAKQKAVLCAIGFSRVKLSELVSGRNLRPGVAGKLLKAMKEYSKPVNPKRLGVIGRAHFERRFLDAGCEMDSFAYTQQCGQANDGRPWIIETAFGMLINQKQRRRLITGVNWSPGIINPFRKLGDSGPSCDTVLADQRIAAADPVILVLHVAAVKPQYTDRGKSAVVVED